MKKSIITDIYERNPSDGPKPMALNINKIPTLKPLSFPSTRHDKNLGIQSQSKPKKPSFNTNNIDKTMNTKTKTRDIQPILQESNNNNEMDDYDLQNEEYVQNLTPEEVEAHLREIAAFIDPNILEQRRQMLLEQQQQQQHHQQQQQQQDYNININKASSSSSSSSSNNKSDTHDVDSMISVPVTSKDIIATTEEELLSAVQQSPDLIRNALEWTGVNQNKSGNDVQQLQSNEDKNTVVVGKNNRFDLEGRRIINELESIDLLVKELKPHMLQLEDSNKDENELQSLICRLLTGLFASGFCVDKAVLKNDPNSDRMLYQHESEPDEPGYTLDECMDMMRSSVPMQRSIAYRLVAGVLHRKEAAACMEPYGSKALQTMSLPDNQDLLNTIEILENRLNESYSGGTPAMMVTVRRLIGFIFQQFVAAYLPPSLPAGLMQRGPGSTFLPLRHAQIQCLSAYLRSSTEETMADFQWRQIGERDSPHGGSGLGAVLVSPHSRRADASYSTLAATHASRLCVMLKALGPRGRAATGEEEEDEDDVLDLLSSDNMDPIRVSSIDEVALLCRWSRVDIILNNNLISLAPLFDPSHSNSNTTAGEGVSMGADMLLWFQTELAEAFQIFRVLTDELDSETESRDASTAHVALEIGIDILEILCATARVCCLQYTLNQLEKVFIKEGKTKSSLWQVAHHRFSESQVEDVSSLDSVNVERRGRKKIMQRMMVFQSLVWKLVTELAVRRRWVAYEGVKHACLDHCIVSLNQYADLDVDVAQNNSKNISDSILEWQVRFWRVCIGYGIPEALVAFQQWQQIFQMKVMSSSSQNEFNLSLLSSLIPRMSPLLASEVLLLCEAAVTVLTCLLEESVIRILMPNTNGDGDSDNKKKGEVAAHLCNLCESARLILQWVDVISRHQSQKWNSDQDSDRLCDLDLFETSHIHLLASCLGGGTLQSQIALHRQLNTDVDQEVKIDGVYSRALQDMRCDGLTTTVLALTDRVQESFLNNNQNQDEGVTLAPALNTLGPWMQLCRLSFTFHQYWQKHFQGISKQITNSGPRTGERCVAMKDVSRCELVCAWKRLTSMIPSHRIGSSTNATIEAEVEAYESSIWETGAADKLCCGILYRRIDFLYQWVIYLKATKATTSVTLSHSTALVEFKDKPGMEEDTNLHMVLRALSTLKAEFGAAVPDLLAYCINSLRLGKAASGSPARVVVSVALQRAFGPYALSSPLINTCLRISVEDVGYEFLSLEGNGDIDNQEEGISGKIALRVPFSPAVFSAAQMVGADREGGGSESKERQDTGMNNNNGDEADADSMAFGLPLPSTWIYSILSRMPSGHFGIVIERLAATYSSNNTVVASMNVENMGGEMLYHLLECTCDGPGERRWFLPLKDEIQNQEELDTVATKSFLLLLLLIMSGGDNFEKVDDFNALVFNTFLTCMSHNGDLGSGFVRQAERRNSLEGQRQRQRERLRHQKEKTIISAVVDDESSLELYKSLLDSSCSQSIQPAVHAASLWALVHPSMPWRGRQLIWSEMGSLRLLQLFEPQSYSQFESILSTKEWRLVAEDSRPVATACLDAVLTLRSEHDRQWLSVTFALYTLAGYIWHPCQERDREGEGERIIVIDRQRSQFFRSFLQKCKDEESVWIIKRVLDIAQSSVPTLYDIPFNLRNGIVALKDLLSEHQ